MDEWYRRLKEAISAFLEVVSRLHSSLQLCDPDSLQIEAAQENTLRLLETLNGSLAGFRKRARQAEERARQALPHEAASRHELELKQARLKAEATA